MRWTLHMLMMVLVADGVAQSEFPPRTPAEVQRLSDAYFLANPVVGNKGDQRYAPLFYGLWFLDGFTSPGATMQTADKLALAAFTAGQAYRLKHPDEVKEIMEGFGFAMMEVAGTYQSGFERSVFRPDHRPDEGWWLSTLGEAMPGTFEERTKGGFRLKVTGFVTPKGHYGMGSFRRQIYAWEMTQE